MRFNLHKSMGDFPLTTEVLKPLINVDEADIQKYLNEISCIQEARAQRLKKSFPKEIDKISGKKVVFLGDSITSDNLGYRTAVTKAADLEGYDGAISGATSAMILHSSKMLIEKVKPDIVFLFIGGNDSVSIEKEGLNKVSIIEYERNIKQIIGWAKNIGAKVLISEIAPIHEERFSKSFSKDSMCHSNKTVDNYNKVVRDAADLYDVDVFSNKWIKEYEKMDLLFEPDGIHLSIKGHDLFAEKWIQAVSRLS